MKQQEREVWSRLLRLGRRAPRRLRLCESLPLGERRFVAVVEFDASRFLLGGTPSSLVLLSRLEDESEAARNEPARAVGARRSTACDAIDPDDLRPRERRPHQPEGLC